MTFTPRNDKVAVGTSSVELCPSLTNRERILLVITNTSTAGQVIYLSDGQDGVVGYGIPLQPNSSWAESRDSKYQLSNERICAISSAVSGQVSIRERIE